MQDIRTTKKRRLLFYTGKVIVILKNTDDLSKIVLDKEENKIMSLC